MQNVWISTLEHIRNKMMTGNESLAEEIRSLLISPSDNNKRNDFIIKISSDLMSRINTFLIEDIYPKCGAKDSTGNCLCVKCTAHRDYKNQLEQQLISTEQSIQQLIDTPFRQSRNAYGVSVSTFGFSNLLLSLVIKTTALSVICPILIAPALLGGAYVYYRGRKEEAENNAKYEADFFEKKVLKLCAHKDALTSENSKTPDQTSLTPSIKRTKPASENRGARGNPFGHFFTVTAGTTGIIVTVLKIGFIASLLALSGPIALGIALGVGAIVGAYFAYRRHENLARKRNFETEMERLNKTDIKPSPISIQPSRLFTSTTSLSDEKNPRPDPTLAIAPTAVTPTTVFTAAATAGANRVTPTPTTVTATPAASP